MRLTRQRALIVCLLLVLGAAAPHRSPAADASGRITATYRVDLAALHLGDFNLIASINGTAYEVEANGRFSLLAGMLYRASGRTMSEGELSKAGPQPAKFTLSFDNGRKKERRKLRFRGGAVQDISIVPKKKRRADRYVPVTDAQLRHVLDPLTAAFLYTRWGGAPGDLKICQQTVPVFDGKQRFDIVLQPKRTETLGERAPLPGPVAVCKVKYVPISGHKPDHSGVKFVTENEDIEVWLVAVPRTALYIPYRVVMPTAWGTGSVTLTEIRIGAN
ncbi:MAG TPA: DUF3108 domain-containing protein [Methyloceanibacter sp.]|nr:DUF3108 domain-containing protein [Methyloceanibacter sp.]